MKIIIISLSFIIAFVCLLLCMNSSEISRLEEREEARQKQYKNEE